MVDSCVNCKHYKDNCGNHFINDEGHINYTLPSPFLCENGIIKCFELSDECNILKSLIHNISNYPSDILKLALLSKGEDNMKIETKTVTFYYYIVLEGMLKGKEVYSFVNILDCEDAFITCFDYVKEYNLRVGSLKLIRKKDVEMPSIQRG